MRTWIAVSVPSRLAPSFTCVVIGWRVRRADELLLPRELPHHRPARLERGEDAEVLGQHLLLAAEAAADALGEDVDVAREQPEEVAELVLGDEGRLRAGADVKPAVVALPGHGAVGLHMHVLDAGRLVGHLVDGVGLAEAVLDAADLAVDVDVDVADRPRRPCREGPAPPAPWPPRGRRRRAGPRTRPRAGGTRPPRRPRSRRRPRRRAGRRSGRRCRGCTCRPDRRGDPRASPCCRAGAGRPPR